MPTHLRDASSAHFPYQRLKDPRSASAQGRPPGSRVQHRWQQITASGLPFDKPVAAKHRRLPE